MGVEAIWKSSASFKDGGKLDKPIHQKEYKD